MVVVLKPGFTASAALVKEIQAVVYATIAPYKCPRHVAFVDSLPKTGTGTTQGVRLTELT